MAPLGQISRISSEIDDLALRITTDATAQGIGTLALLGISQRVGATTLSIALARAIAKPSHPVVLVDAAGASSKFYNPLGIPPAPGLCEVLQGDLAPEDALHPLGNEAVSVLTFGGEQILNSPLPSPHLLESLLIKLRPREGLVLVDAGAVESATAIAAAQACDAAILIIEAGRTSSEILAASKLRLEERGIEILGVVLNKRRYPVPRLFYS